jgi:hypothetical protein
MQNAEVRIENEEVGSGESLFSILNSHFCILHSRLASEGGRPYDELLREFRDTILPGVCTGTAPPSSPASASPDPGPDCPALKLYSCTALQLYLRS